MASEKIIEQKQGVIKEIIDNFKNSESVVFFEYSGLNVADMTQLRKSLRENNADMKIYKNTLTKRALVQLNFDLEKDDQETPEMTDDVVNAIKGFAQLMGKDFAYNSYVDKGFDSEEVKKALDC